jgi:methyl-accepting chemotaxis protein
MFKRIKLAIKLPAIMIFLTAAALTISSFVFYNNAANSLHTESEKLLQTVEDARTAEILGWEENLRGTLMAQTLSSTVTDALRGFTQMFAGIEGDPVATLHKSWITDNPYPPSERNMLETSEDGSPYSYVHSVYHPYFHALQVELGLVDIFLFDTEGNVIYTVFKEVDFAQNLLTGELKESGLGRVYAKAMAQTTETLVFEDFSVYAPSNNAPAGFIATPVIDFSGAVVGAIAFQLPIDRIDMIMQRSSGLGQSGEAFLVGSDLYLRSNLRLLEGDEVLKIMIPTEAVKRSISGETGVLVDDVLIGEEVMQYLAAYSPVNFFGETYGLVVGQHMGEILAPARALGIKFLWQGALMLLAVAAIALLVARSLSKPLTSVETAMRKVSDADYTGSVPGTNRGDEIGGIANALDDFRVALQDAEASRRDGQFKGAAFEGSSASLMMINQDFEIIYTNSAASELMKLHEESFARHMDGFDADHLIGKTIDIFHKNPDQVRALLSDPASLPLSTEIKVDDVYFSLDVNSVCNAEGAQIGCVMEWKDVTLQRKNQAIIETINRNQCKAEFGMDGKLREANENFAATIGPKTNCSSLIPIWRPNAAIFGSAFPPENPFTGALKSATRTVKIPFSMVFSARFKILPAALSVLSFLEMMSPPRNVPSKRQRPRGAQCNKLKTSLWSPCAKGSNPYPKAISQQKLPKNLRRNMKPFAQISIRPWAIFWRRCAVWLKTPIRSAAKLWKYQTRRMTSHVAPNNKRRPLKKQQPLLIN